MSFVALVLYHRKKSPRKRNDKSVKELSGLTDEHVKILVLKLWRFRQKKKKFEEIRVKVFFIAL